MCITKYKKNKIKNKSKEAYVLTKKYVAKPIKEIRIQDISINKRTKFLLNLLSNIKCKCVLSGLKGLDLLTIL